MQNNNLSDTLQAAQALGLDRLDAQILLLHALQKPTYDRAWLLSHDTDELTTAQQHIFEGFIKRRIDGESVAYIVGHKSFFGLNFSVDARVLVPRPDTECLVEWALACIETIAASDVLDLGTGSGAIGLAIKHNCPNANVTLVDASQAALDVALGNATSLGLAGIGFEPGLRGLQSNWFASIPNDERFDLIVSNPPYIADGDAHLTALTYEPLMALTSGADGLDAIRRIVQDAPRYLKTGGWLLLEHGFDQAAAVRELLRDRGFEQVTSRLDLNGIERCSGGTLKSVI